jgi:hypothetical protein
VKTSKRSLCQIGLFGIILVAAFCYPLPSGFSIASTNRPPQPLWENDLAKIGYQGRPPVHLGPEDNWGFSTYTQGVVFMEPGVLAAFFVVHDDPPGTSSDLRKPLPTDPFRLVVVFFNSEKGELIKKLDWPLPSTAESVSEPFFFPATRGRFVVGIGNTLSLYSPDFKMLAQHTADAEIEGIASPSGETILLEGPREVGGQWAEQLDLIETEGLKVLKSWKSSPQQNQILWGDEIASMTPQSISIRTPDTEAKPFLQGREWACGYWSFINREMLAIQCDRDGVEKLFVVSTEGKILHQFDLGLEQGDGPVVPSRNGKRFAMPTRHWGSGGKDPQKLIARVFGIDADQPILTVGVTPHYSSSANFDTPKGDTRFGWGGLALSPDGELLAVKSGPIVQMYQLPEPGRSGGCAGNCASEEEAANPRPALGQQESKSTAPIPPAAPSRVFEQVLSWLPADTETVIAANGPFQFPDLNPEGDVVGPVKESDDIADAFKAIPLGLFGLKKRILLKYFKGKVLFALEGSRDFRVPSGLGEGQFQGCGVAVFAEDVRASAGSFLEENSAAVLRTEQIEGQQVTVFQETLENDTWTTFVAFPKPNIAIAATNEEYLQQVLARINGKRGERALPEGLPEWKYVNTHAGFWALRHYDKKGASIDPSSPFAGGNAGMLSDDQAVGLAFNFDPSRSKTATITYLSGDKKILANVQEHLFPAVSEPGVREMHIRYREIAPGVVEGSFDLEHIESAEVFGFVLVMLLGHMVAV